MKNKITGNEPAMPSEVEYINVDEWKDFKIGENIFKTGGLTIRQQFAAMAMQGLCANYLRENITGWNIKTYAVESVALADALINELNKSSKLIDPDTENLHSHIDDLEKTIKELRQENYHLTNNQITDKL